MFGYVVCMLGDNAVNVISTQQFIIVLSFISAVSQSNMMILIKRPLKSCLNFKPYDFLVCFIETRKTAFGIISTVKKPRPSEGDDDSLPACKKAKCED